MMLAQQGHTASHSSYRPHLDGWRGIAIALLLAGHFLPFRGMNLGGLGVDFFFVLSGLLMGRLLFIDRVAIPLFYRRRIARVFPLAYFFVLCVAVWQMLRPAPVEWLELAAAASFLNNYIHPDHAQLPLGHFWSLCVEEHSYVVLALIAVAARARGASGRTAIGLALLSFVAIGAVYSITYTGPDLYHERWLHSEVSAFGIFVSAFLLVQLDGRTFKAGWMGIAVLGAAGVMLHWWRVPPFWRTFAGVTALAMALHLIERGPAWIQSLLSVRPLRQLGIWSFSIYVWQQPFYMAVEAGRLPIAAGIAGALLAGIASFYLVERPTRVWLNQRWRGAAPRPSAVSTEPC